MSNDQDVLNTLVQAMINEQDGKEFYLAAVDVVSDEKGKSMCRGLANDEAEHLRILQAEYARMSDGNAFVDLETARASRPPQPDLTLFPEKSQLPDMLRAAKNDEGVLKVALHFELKGYQMYDQAAKNAYNPNEREVFAYLADQESRHYEGIQKTLHYLQDKGAWFFDDLEAPFFEG